MQKTSYKVDITIGSDLVDVTVTNDKYINVTVEYTSIVLGVDITSGMKIIPSYLLTENGYAILTEDGYKFKTQ